MRVLLSGGAGFIGSAACRHFVLNSGWTVLNLDRLTYAASPASLASLEGNPRYSFIRGDICDTALLRATFRDFQPDAVVHLAAESHVDRSIFGSDAFIRTNIVGTHSLLEAARGYWAELQEEARTGFRFLHVSTDEVFGSLGATGQFTESTPYDPRSPYSASKAASDHIARAWWHTFGMPIIVSNCSNNYGPRQFPEKLIPLVILNALEGKPLPVYGDGQNVRDWLFVDDHVRALEAIIARGMPGDTYAIGGNEERTNLDVVQTICDLVDELAPSATLSPRRDLIRFVADRPGHDRRYAIDPSHIQKTLGWRPSLSFGAGLARTVTWYLENEQWWAPLRQERYGGERLGLSEASGS